MIPITTYAPVQGWKQKQPGGGVAFVMHTFESDEHGALVHRTDGDIRAIVPPEGWEAYAEAWPDCQPIIDQLRLAPAKPAANDEPAAAAPASATTDAPAAPDLTPDEKSLLQRILGR